MSPEWNGTLVRVVLDSSFRVALVAASVALILAAVRVHSSGVRHAAWTAVLCTMLLMPILPYIVPSIALPVPAPSAGIQAVLELTEAPPPSGAVLTDASYTQALAPEIPPAPAAAAGPAQASAWPAIVLAIYGAGLLVLLGRLLLGWRSMSRIVRMSAPVVLEGECLPNTQACAAPVHESGWVAAPLTAGITVPRIILPVTWREWPAEKLSAILAHEFAHVRRHDPLIGLLAHLNRCVFWFHPLAWWLERKLAVTAELACDDAGPRSEKGLDL